MPTRDEDGLLAAAELWEVRPGRRSPARARPVLLVAGWEDADTFCAAVCTNDVGLGFCRRCPEAVVRQVLETGHAAHGTCGAGVGMFAFPAPRGSRRQVALLRVRRPSPRQAASIATTVRVAPATLRRSARQARDPAPRAVLAAARTLRSTEGLTLWRVRTREMAAMRRRTTTAALAQMIVTGDEYYELYRTSQRQVRELERSQRRIDALAREAMRELEAARAAIAHRIHDTAAQSLVGAFRHLEAAQATVAAESRAEEQLRLASSRLSTAIGEVRAVMSDLLPPGLEELGLGSAVSMRIDALNAEARRHAAPPPGDGSLAAVQERPRPAIALEGRLPRLLPWVEQALYGATIEAITNAVRHAGASHILVRMRESGTRAVIEVRDDGHGFDPALAARRAGEGHLGLLGIVRQARWLGGSATIHSRAGGGTRIRISLPVARHRADAAGPVGEPSGAALVGSFRVAGPRAVAAADGATGPVEATRQRAGAGAGATAMGETATGGDGVASPGQEARPAWDGGEGRS